MKVDTLETVIHEEIADVFEATEDPVWLEEVKARSDLTVPSIGVLPFLSADALKELQRADPVLSRVLTLRPLGKLSRRQIRKEDKRVRKILSEMDRLIEKDGGLYRVVHRIKL